jgi:hypothetical protein
MSSTLTFTRTKGAECPSCVWITTFSAQCEALHLRTGGLFMAHCTHMSLTDGKVALQLGPPCPPWRQGHSGPLEDLARDAPER